ncbi:MAG TPA: hypothetical protein VJO34_01235 [Methylomirabilota bacterium]|nr:hypothetical protein [Methylomirabilota bacterium]
MQAKLFPRPPEVFSPPREPSAAADLIAVRYLRPPSATVGRVITGVVAGLFYLLMAVDGLTIALFGMASLLGLVLKFVGWLLGAN